MSMGNYTCNLCGTCVDTASKQLPPGRGSRWSCSACGDDFCFDCRPERGMAPVERDWVRVHEAVDGIGEYGLATRADAASAAEHKEAETRSTTPHDSFVPHSALAATRHAPPPASEISRPPPPIVRCGLGFRLCHSSLGKLSIDSVLPGGAADRDGRLQAGDQILAINGDSTKNLIDAEEVAKSLVGVEGSSVHLLAIRPGAGEPPFEVLLERRMFDGQFDSIHSGPTPRLPPCPDERPRSMSIVDSVLQAERAAEHVGVSGPLSTPVRLATGSSQAGKRLTLDDLVDSEVAHGKTDDCPVTPVDHTSELTVSGPPKPESPESLHERLDRAIRRRSPPLSPGASQSTNPDQIKTTSTASSEIPIEELLARYAASPARSAPHPSVSALKTSKSSPEPEVSVDATTNDQSMPLIDILPGPMDTVLQTEPDAISTLQHQSAIAAPENSESAGPDSNAMDVDSRVSVFCAAEEEQEPAAAAAEEAESAEVAVAVGGQVDPTTAVEALHEATETDNEEDSQLAPPAQPLTAPAVLGRKLHLDTSFTLMQLTPATVSPSLELLAAESPTMTNFAMDPTAEVTRPTEQILRKGWLVKESASGLKSMFLKSQKRWCVLKTGNFQYFHNQSEDGRSEVMSLASIEAVTIETKKNVPFLVIKTPQRSFTFCSPDKSSATTVFEWLQDITKALIDAPAQTPNSPGAAPQAAVSVAAPSPSEAQQPHSQAPPSPFAVGGSSTNASHHAQPGQVHASKAAPMLIRPVQQTAPQWVSPGHAVPPLAHSGSVPPRPMDAVHSGTQFPSAGAMSSPAQPWGHAPGTGIQRVYVDSEYEQYSSMYEHEALATRTGILISADISPSMAAMTVNEIDQPPPMRAH
jgi:hypothetical protein